MLIKSSTRAHMYVDNSIISGLDLIWTLGLYNCLLDTSTRMSGWHLTLAESVSEVSITPHPLQPCPQMVLLSSWLLKPNLEVLFAPLPTEPTFNTPRKPTGYTFKYIQSLTISHCFCCTMLLRQHHLWIAAELPNQLPASSLPHCGLSLTRQPQGAF